MTPRRARKREPARPPAEAPPGAVRKSRPELVAELFGTGDAASARDRFLRTGEVAVLFQVSPRAVTEWARRGRIRFVRTPGGHRRYPAAEVRRLLLEAQELPPEA